MAQNDKQHIGDSQNSQWWGTKQGLNFNGINQNGQFTVDPTWESLISQNNSFSIESYSKGSCVFSNGIYGASADQLYLTGFYYNGTTGYLNLTDITSKRCYLLLKKGFSISNANTIYSLCTITRVANQMFYNCATLDSILLYSSLPPNLTALNIIMQRIKNFNKIQGFASSYLTTTDNIYPASLKTMSLNYGNNSLDGVSGNSYKSGVVRNLRVYTRVITDKEKSDNYHSFSSTNTTNLFAEWKLSQLSDFYTFGGNLYARNTGTSGNGLDNGTGYDMKLLGYAGNVPTFATIY